MWISQQRKWEGIPSLLGRNIGLGAEPFLALLVTASGQLWQHGIEGVGGGGQEAQILHANDSICG